jgi:NADPH:quinone reductase-like Zn-dependent oxidoreductase
MSGGKKLMSMTVKPNKDLDFLSGLLETGKIKSMIDKQFPLSEAVEALRYYHEGHTSGKVIVTVP